MIAKKKKEAKPKPMSARGFMIILKKLGLTVASQRTAKALGLSIRQVQRVAIGEQPVPPPVELLLKAYLKYPKAVPRD